MKIILFGDSCPSCKTTIKNITEAAAQLDPTIEIEESEDLIKMVRLNVFQTPAVVINDKVVAQGKRLSFNDALAIIQQNR